MENTRQRLESQHVDPDIIPRQAGGQSGEHLPERAVSRWGGFPRRVKEKRVPGKIRDDLPERIAAIHPRDPAVKNIIVNIQGVIRSHEQEHKDEGQRTADDDDPGCPASCLGGGTHPHNIEKSQTNESQHHAQVSRVTGVMQEVPIQEHAAIKREQVGGQGTPGYK